MRAVVSLRVSTDEQADSGAGLAAQLDACTKWAERAGAEVVGPFADEGVCGATSLDKRPALLEAINQLRKGDVLLFAKRDRLGRDPILCAMVEAAARRKGARVVSAAGEGTENDDPTSILMRRIVDAFSEYERLVIKARTKAALQAKIRRGERCGKVRFGFQVTADGKRLIANTAEQGTLATIRELRGQGMSYREIAGELTGRGIRTKEGKTVWIHTAVKRILDRVG